MTTSRRSFSWSWVIGGLAALVIVMTILIPPPGRTAKEDGEEEERADSGTVVSIPDTISILVLNGTNHHGEASRTQRDLIAASVDSRVIIAPFEPGNTRMKPYAETVVVSHLRDISAARIIAGHLGITCDHIVWEVYPDPGKEKHGVDVVIRLGEDILFTNSHGN